MRAQETCPTVAFAGRGWSPFVLLIDFGCKQMWSALDECERKGFGCVIQDVEGTLCSIRLLLFGITFFQKVQLVVQ